MGGTIAPSGATGSFGRRERTVSDDSTIPDEDELRGLCADLLSDWDLALNSSNGHLTLGRSDQAADPARFATTFAFVAHAHHLVKAACELLANGDYASAVPLLRVAYESAISAVWSADSTEATKAIELELMRGAKNLRMGLVETGLFEGVLDQLPEPTERLALEDVDREAIDQARRFNRMCEALEPEGVWVYQQFRLLSGLAHPSGSVISMFVPGSGELVHASPVPAGSASYLSWWHAAGMTLLHAGQALDRLDPEGRRTETLKRAGVVLGWETPLGLKKTARDAPSDALGQ